MYVLVVLVKFKLLKSNSLGFFLKFSHFDIHFKYGQVDEDSKSESASLVHSFVAQCSLTFIIF